MRYVEICGDEEGGLHDPQDYLGLRRTWVRGALNGKWSDPGVPHKGWRCIDLEDLGEGESAICEMCEVREIRFVHRMEHSEYPDTLGCGCICAGHMEEDYTAAHERERQARSWSDRRRRFGISQRWRLLGNGGQYRVKDDYVVFVDRVASGGWTFSIKNRERQTSLRARKIYPTPVGAKMTAFDAIEWMRRRGR